MDSKMKLQDLEKVRILGQGTYGKCYLVHNRIGNDLCVLKQIEIFGMSEQQQEQVIRQAKILSALNHPTIVKFLSCFKTQSYLNIVMQYADGGDLNKIIKDSKGALFSENQVLNWFTQICLAIKHIHDRKVIHRDLKCQNIFMTKQGKIKLGDFGIARHLSKTLDKIKTVVGTPYYMSPQICENRDYSFKTDIWSLGVILYEMCAHKLPFEGGSLAALALRISKGEYQPLTGNQYSKQLKNLIKILLQSNPNRRPTINKVLQNPLLSKRVQDYLPKHVFQKQFSHTTLHSHNLFQKQNDRQNYDQSVNKQYMLFQNKSQHENKQVHSARSHNVGIKAVKSPQSSKNNDYRLKMKELGMNKQYKDKAKKKKIQAFKRREISQPNLALKRNAIKSQGFIPIQQTQRIEVKKQLLSETLYQILSQKYEDKIDQLIENVETQQGFILQKECENPGLLTLYWGLQKFQE